MDINLLVLNVGNSRLSVGVFVAGALEYSTRISLDQRADWAGKVKEAWMKIEAEENAAVAGVSVNPPLLEAIEHTVNQVTGKKVEWVGRELDLPIGIATEQPNQTGADRVVNMAAAYEQMGKACVVVDAGSAITVDVCDDDGRFLGGAIAPGAGMQLAALHEKTASLPHVTLDTPAAPFGQSTEQAIRHGVYHGIRGLIKEVVENYATELGNWPDIIATGGDAPKLFEGWELIHAIAPDLTLYGVAKAYADHHIRHES